jgi:hypothetical protein
VPGEAQSFIVAIRAAMAGKTGCIVKNGISSRRFPVGSRRAGDIGRPLK